MAKGLIIRPIAHIVSDFPDKFGIPRQSGLIDELISRIVFEPDYQNPEALRGLEGYSHLWLIWDFSLSHREIWSPTVRPPRLGGNKRMGVFATRSPNRPNPLGLSSVRLEKIEYATQDGAVLHVRGADLKNGTPIFDIKPYLPFTDSHPDAVYGFAEQNEEYSINVMIPQEFESIIPDVTLKALRKILESDPRPAYHKDTERTYSFEFAGYRIKFKAAESNTLIVTLLEKI